MAIEKKFGVVINYIGGFDIEGLVILDEICQRRQYLRGTIMRRNRLGKVIRAGLFALSIVGATAFATVFGVVNVYAADHTVNVTEEGTNVELEVIVGDTIHLNVSNVGRSYPIGLGSYYFRGTGFSGVSPDVSVGSGSAVSFNMSGSAQTSGVIEIGIFDEPSSNRLSALTIYLTVVDGSGNVVGTRSWVNAGGGTGTGTGAGTGADNNSGSGSTGDVPPHVHSYEWKTTKEPTADADGEEIYVCACGDVKYRQGIPAIGVFEEESANKIKNAPMFGTVNIETSNWNTFGRGMRDALTARSDVTLKVSFLSEGHKGTRLNLTIPAGCDIASLYDENGFCGLCNAGTILGYDQ